jgi:hypothetical protein
MTSAVVAPARWWHGRWPKYALLVHGIAALAAFLGAWVLCPLWRHCASAWGGDRAMFVTLAWLLLAWLLPLVILVVWSYGGCRAACCGIASCCCACLPRPVAPMWLAPTTADACSGPVVVDVGSGPAPAKSCLATNTTNARTGAGAGAGAPLAPSVPARVRWAAGTTH